MAREEGDHRSDAGGESGEEGEQKGDGYGRKVGHICLTSGGGAWFFDSGV